MGQNGTFVPSSCDTASARAVLPVLGPPASSTARPDICFDLTSSTTIPHACESEGRVSQCFPLQMNRKSPTTSDLSSTAHDCRLVPIPRIASRVCPRLSTHLSGSLLPDEPGGNLLRVPVRLQAQALDVRVRRRPVLPRIPLHFADLHHCVLTLMACTSRERSDPFWSIIACGVPSCVPSECTVTGCWLRARGETGRGGRLDREGKEWRVLFQR